MSLPSFISLEAIAGIGTLVLFVIQYIKDSIPEKFIRWCTILVGIGLSFLWFYQPGASYDFVAVIASGILAAIGADTGYNFLSPAKSPTFSLPSKESK